MADNISRVFLFTFCLVLATTACVNTATSTAPADPPQVTVLKYVQLGATADNTAAHVLVTLCAAQSGQTVPTLDASDCSAYAGYLKVFPPVFDAIATEAASSDPWATMRVKIAELAAKAAVSATITNPTVKAQVDGLTAIVNQILGVK